MGQIKILIIDDDDMMRRMASHALQKAGYTVFEANNGMIGVPLFKAHLPDVVITDILMPDKEGIETISDIIAYEPTAKIIAMSGGGSSVKNLSYLRMASNMGASFVLQKPFIAEDLLQAVQTVLGGGI